MTRIDEQIAMKKMMGKCYPALSCIYVVAVVIC
jgi:hypothetical protein